MEGGGGRELGGKTCLCTLEQKLTWALFLCRLHAMHCTVKQALEGKCNGSGPYIVNII